MKERLLILLFIFFGSIDGFTQKSVVGYIYETGNRGYIANAAVQIVKGEEVLAESISDASGQYEIKNILPGDYQINISKPPFISYQEQLSLTATSDERVFLKHEVSRLPGYVFEITLAEKDGSPDGYRTGLEGALVEVYNNTTRTEELVISNLQDPEFKVDFIKGNHYTILIRKEGFLAKRMEAYVDVESCILCFEGVGKVTPGVSDNLTNENSNGVLLANVQLERFKPSEVIGLRDIYYKSNSAILTSSSRASLDDVAIFIRDNPQLILELGAHTDSNGKASYNQDLSQRRADEVVSYLVDEHKIPGNQLIAHGYGENQPVNDCGSRCSEAEHAENRRTELKILEVRDGFERRSLRQMKLDENMDAILAELEAEGQIQIPEEPEESTIDQGSVGEILDQVQPSTNLEVEDDLNEQVEVVDEVPVKSQEDWMAHQAVPVVEDDSNTQAADNISDGYKIVIMFSRYELVADHPLFNRFPDLEVYTTADGNKLYMIESYDTRRGAERRFETKYATSFPRGYVVGFREGIIVD